MYGDNLTREQIAQLTGQGECFLHSHPKELLIFADLVQLMLAEPQTEVSSATYTPTNTDSVLLVDTSAFSVTVTLPALTNGREYKVVKVSPANALYVVPEAPGTVLGSTAGVVLYNDYSSLHLKATATRGWIAI